MQGGFMTILVSSKLSHVLTAFPRNPEVDIQVLTTEGKAPEGRALVLNTARFYFYETKKQNVVRTAGKRLCHRCPLRKPRFCREDSTPFIGLRVTRECASLNGPVSRIAIMFRLKLFVTSGFWCFVRSIGWLWIFVVHYVRQHFCNSSTGERASKSSVVPFVPYLYIWLQLVSSFQ